MDDVLKKHQNYIEINRACYNALASEYYVKNKQAAAKTVAKDLSKMIFDALDTNIENDVKKILEIGPGSGTLLYTLNDCGQNVLYGIELSEKMADYAKKESNSNIIVANILDINDIYDAFNKQVDKFDVIIMAALIHLFPKKDAIKLLNKTKGWLESNGLIYIDTTKENTFCNGKISEKKGYNIKVKRLRTRWTEYEFEKMLKNRGFEIIKKQDHEDNNEKTWLRRVIRFKQ